MTTPPPAPPPPPSSPPPPGGYGAAPGPERPYSPWGTYAEWGPRALGLLIDYGIGVGGWLAIWIVALILGAISNALFVIVILLGGLALTAFHIWIAVQVGQTGASPGMRVIGLRCVGKTTGQPIGGGLGFVRSLAHIIDSLICYIGWLFPLWDREKQTIADKVMSTVVVEAPKQPFSLTPPRAGAGY